MKNLNNEYKRVRYSFWLLWMGVGTLFTTVAFYLSYYIGSAGFFAGLLAFGVPGGILVGIVQWLALRPYLKQASWWILVTFMGWEIGWIIFYLPETLVRDCFFLPVSGLLLGLSIGISQWVILRQQVSDAYWWIGANILAGFLGIVIGFYIGQTLAFRTGDDILAAIIFETVYSLISGIIFTVITGTVLVWLLSRTPHLKSVQK